MALGVTVYDCKGHTANQIVAAKLDKQGQVIDGNLYRDEDATPKLSENRKKYADACQAFLANQGEQAHELPTVRAPKVLPPSPPQNSTLLPPKPPSNNHPVSSAQVAALTSVSSSATHREIVSTDSVTRANKHANRNMDLRYCLELKTNAEIIACSEK